MTDRQRLFLGSAGLGALPSWIASIPVKPERAVLVPTAANRLPSAPFVEVAAHVLRAEDVIVDRLDLEHANNSEVRHALRNAQLVFVTGGYAMFLLQHVRRTDFGSVLSPAVHKGHLAYAGISAGAALAGPDLHALSATDDPGIVVSTLGLGLVPFTVLAHRNRGRAARHDQYAAQHGGPDQVISINDDQAIMVEDGTWKIVKSPSEFGDVCQER